MTRVSSKVSHLLKNPLPKTGPRGFLRSGTNVVLPLLSDVHGSLQSMTLLPSEDDHFEPDPADLCPTCHVEYVTVTAPRKRKPAQTRTTTASFLSCPSCGLRKKD